MITFTEKLLLVVQALRKMHERRPEQTDDIMLAIVMAAESLHLTDADPVEPEPGPATVS